MRKCASLLVQEALFASDATTLDRWFRGLADNDASESPFIFKHPFLFFSNQSEHSLAHLSAIIK